MMAEQVETRQLTPEDITEAFVERFYDDCVDGWTPEGERVDWESVMDRAERAYPQLDWGVEDFWVTPGILKLQREIRRIRRENGIG